MNHNFGSGVDFDMEIDADDNVFGENDSITVKQELKYTMTSNPRKRGVGIGSFHFSDSGSIGDVFSVMKSRVGQTSNNKYWNWQDILGNFVSKSEVGQGYSLIKIENPKRIEITVSDDPHEPSYYCGLGHPVTTAYELAELHANGYGHVIPRDMFKGMQEYAAGRDFLFDLNNVLQANMSRGVRMKNDNDRMRYSARIDWEDIADFCVEEMKDAMARNEFRFPAVKQKTQEEREAAGIDPTEHPLYATGKLADCIIAEIVDDFTVTAQSYDDEVPF